MPEPRWYQIQNRTLPSPVAVIDLFGEIGDYGVSADQFVSELRSLSASRIKVFINSPGGSVFDGLTILNALRSSRVPVETYGMGMVASIASVIFQGASPGKRFMAPNARMMIHRASVGGVGGDSEDLAQMVERLQDATKNIASIFAERSGKPADYWLGVMNGTDKWFDPEQAVAEGLADAVGLDEGDHDEQALAFGVLLSMPRHEIAACLSNTGRTLSASNLDKLHGVFATLNSIHSGACDLGDGCPMAPMEPTNQGEQPINRRDALSRDVDQILARMGIREG